MDHKILLEIIKRKIKDENVVWLIKKILNNFETSKINKGMPLGNLTSQFFANICLNELDRFVKNKLKARYYIRYVDDFIILNNNKENLKEYKNKITKYLNYLKLELHPDKTKILPLSNGTTFLGYKIFYQYKLLKKKNIKKFNQNFKAKLKLYKKMQCSSNNILSSLEGWLGYAKWANTYKIQRKRNRVITLHQITNPNKNF